MSNMTISVVGPSKAGLYAIRFIDGAGTIRYWYPHAWTTDYRMAQGFTTKAAAQHVADTQTVRFGI